jgi:hypothetical protein
VEAIAVIVGDAEEEITPKKGVALQVRCFLTCVNWTTIRKSLTLPCVDMVVGIRIPIYHHCLP